MNIQTVPLTDTYFITFFQSNSISSEYSISKSGTVVYNKKYIESGFFNTATNYPNHLTIKLSSITDDIAKDILLEAGIDGISKPYINYSNRELVAENAVESLNSFIKENWNGRLDLTWVIIPKKNKGLNGKKIVIEFNVGAFDFGHEFKKMDLDVFMSSITRTSKSVTFSVKIPKFLYDKCMTNNIVEDRPKRDYIESNTLSGLHSSMDGYVSMAHRIEKTERDAKAATKVICIQFKSSESTTRDNLNHAYTGQSIATTFQFFVAYKTKGTHSESVLFSYKKHQHGTGTTEKGIKGVIDTELAGKRNYISNIPRIIIAWTQEREDFLTKLEERFRNLSENLNMFLADLDENKLEKLITNSHLLQIGSKAE